MQIMQHNYKLYTCALLFICLSISGFSQTVKSYAVMVKREGISTPIKLVWDKDNTTNNYNIYRRTPGQLNWGASIATKAANDTFYVENLASGTYEYYVQRNLTNGQRGHGYIVTSALVADAVATNRMLLVVDANYVQPLAIEINQLIKDLVADGWFVDTLNVQRNTSVFALKQRITKWYNTYKNDTHKPQQLYLLGRIPVPYSGVIFPDGHTPDHKGAWPADVYYADMNGTWNDVSVNDISASDQRHHNVPGDGKFDESVLPSDVELEVSRVDFYNLPTFSNTETMLMQNYLVKLHAYKTRQYIPRNIAVVEDNFLIALVVEKVCLYLFMTKCQTEMFLEALFDLRAQLVDVDLIHVFRHEIHDLCELVISTPSVLA
jgi:hypothetical protein